VAISECLAGSGPVPDARDDDEWEPVLAEADQRSLVTRLIRLVQMTSIAVRAKAGPFDDEVAADKTAISAIRALVGMERAAREKTPHPGPRRAGTQTPLPGGPGRGDEEVGPRWILLTMSERRLIVARLMLIAHKQFVVVQTKDGPKQDELIAHKNAIAATRALTAFDALSRQRPGRRKSSANRSRDELAREGDRHMFSKTKNEPVPASSSDEPLDDDQSPTIQEMIQEAIRSGAAERMAYPDDDEDVEFVQTGRNIYEPRLVKRRSAAAGSPPAAAEPRRAGTQKQVSPAAPGLRSSGAPAHRDSEAGEQETGRRGDAAMRRDEMTTHQPLARSDLNRT